MSAALSQHGETIGRRLECDFGIVKKFDERGDVFKVAAYNGCRVVAGREPDQTFDFTRKSSEHVTHFTMSPDGMQARPWHADPASFWRKADEAEKRHDGQVARQILLGIPRGIPQSEYRPFIEAACEPWRAAGMFLHVDIHCPLGRDGLPQPHAHILATMREMELDGSGFRKNKQGRPRTWNATFMDAGSRTERARVEADMNRWLEAHVYADRAELRSNTEIHGPDALPPEPSLPRAVIEAAKRTPDNPPAEIISLEKRRRLHQSARRLQDEARALQAEIVELEEERDRLAARERRDMAHRPQGQRRQGGQPWMAQDGGFDALSPALQASARRSYERWAKGKNRDGQSRGDLHSLEDYVAYVQGQRSTEKGWRFERPADDANAVSAPPAEIMDSDAPPSPEVANQERAPATPRGDSEDEFPEDEGWTRETRFRARLLAGHYKIAESSLPPDQVAAITRIRIDRNRGVATIELATGDTFEDFGDRIVSPRDPSPETAAQIAQAARLHGWSTVQLTGTPAYRDEVGIALGLLEPPVSHDWKMSREAKARLDALLAARAAAIANTNTITGVLTPENVVKPDARPTPEPAQAPILAVVMRDGKAVSSDWLSANRDAYAGWSAEQFKGAFPVFSWTPPANSDGADRAEAAWDEGVKSAIASWEAESHSLADIPIVAPRTLFITRPEQGHSAYDFEAADMRDRPQLASVATKIARLTDEALENKLKRAFPHYNPTEDHAENDRLRAAAIATWKAARDARIQETAHASPASSPRPAPTVSQRVPGVDDADVPGGLGEESTRHHAAGQRHSDGLVGVRSASDADSHHGSGWSHEADADGEDEVPDGPGLDDEEVSSFRFG
ncbi:MobA/MobL family protein [Asaia sp. VD9]|uniref:MobA/MobL family protein n=1 Tax=Asaia sp. VD9 TaxID=3081235 RepID=UPI003018C2C1